MTRSFKWAPNTALIVTLQVLALLALWIYAPADLLPKPADIGTAWLRLVADGFLGDIITSLLLTTEAILFTAGIGLGLSYLSVMPRAGRWVRPLAHLVCKLRFNSLVGLTLFFVLFTSDGHQLKLSLMVFGMTTWFVTAMLSVIAAIPREEYDLARTMGFTRLQVLKEVVILGTAHDAFDVIRQNAAMGWMMLTMVEGITRTDGGIGAMLISQSKYLHLDAVFAIQITIILIGIGLDAFLEFLRVTACPYADLQKEAV